MYLEAPTKNVPFNHVKKIIEMGLVKLRGLRKKSLLRGDPLADETFGEKGRVKAELKQDVKKHKMAEHEVHPDGQSLNVIRT